MKQFDKAYLSAQEILLPNLGTQMEKWAVIACDQFTSDPAYWQDAEKIVGAAPSALRLTLPEIYLNETELRTPAINAAMAQYLKDGVFAQVRDAFVLVRRQTSTGMRTGLIAALDLEAYDFNADSTAPVRATEGTILSRIPPRVAIRENAPIELPHVMVLFDDPENTVLGPISQKADQLPCLYDFDLMLGGGHIQGLKIDRDEDLEAIAKALEALADPDLQAKKYGEAAKEHPLLFAVGDGNHSLATAKTVWEKKKAAGASSDDPARYALVELVNLHDESLVFEPIHRILFGASVEDLTQAFEKWLPEHPGPGGEQSFIMHFSGKTRIFAAENGTHTLPVGTLQLFLDEYLAAHPQVEIDYIHDDDALLALANQPGNIGFLLPAISKNAFFAGVVQCGPMPRKTFSMGISRDKRYYLEARRIL